METPIIRRMARASLPLLVLGSLVVVAPAAAAAPPEAVTFSLEADFSVAPPDLTWSSAGAVEDSGTFGFGRVLFAAVPSPVVGTLHQDLTLVGEDGTIDIRGQGLLTLGPVPGVFEVAGSWVIMDGEGDYATLHGQGSFLLVLHADLGTPDTATFTGHVFG